MQVLQIGASPTPVCGVRDYSRVLDGVLAGEGASAGRVWWERRLDESLSAGLSNAREWCTRVETAVGSTAAGWILWHYTPNMYGFRGLPYLVPPVARRLSRMRVPLVVLLHELATGWRGRGWRGFGQASTHRLALVAALRACDAAIVTTDDRQEWLQGSAWLPRRPVLMAPVFSGVPMASHEGHGRPDGSALPVIGIFGYGGFGPEEILIDVIVDALARVKRSGLKTRLLFVGHPGPASPIAEAWRRAGGQAGLDEMEFTGVVEREALSPIFRSVDLMIMPDRSGPTSRKSTLAANLAHGLPVVGFEAPTAWRQLAAEHAVRLAPKTGEGLGHALIELLRDDELRLGLGVRAERFYEQNLRPELIARRLLAFLEKLPRGAGVAGRRGEVRQTVGQKDLTV